MTDQVADALTKIEAELAAARIVGFTIGGGFGLFTWWAVIRYLRKCWHRAQDTLRPFRNAAVKLGSR